MNAAVRKLVGRVGLLSKACGSAGKYMRLADSNGDCVVCTKETILEQELSTTKILIRLPDKWVLIVIHNEEV